MLHDSLCGPLPSAGVGETIYEYGVRIVSPDQMAAFGGVRPVGIPRIFATLFLWVKGKMDWKADRWKRTLHDLVLDRLSNICYAYT